MKKNDIAALNSCALLTGLSEKLSRELLSSGEYRIGCFAKGEKIFSPENAPRSLAIILKGTAEVSKSTGKGTLYRAY